MNCFYVLRQNIDVYGLCAKAAAFRVGGKETVHKNPPVHHGSPCIGGNRIAVNIAAVRRCDIKLCPVRDDIGVDRYGTGL